MCVYVHLGLRKKLEKISKLKECKIIGLWIKSICNYLYWCAVSTPDGNPYIIKEKWLSLVNHVHNQHKDYSHGRLRGRQRKKVDSLS